MTNNKNVNEIYLGELIVNLFVSIWKSKIIIISVSFLFLIFGHLYTQFYNNKKAEYAISYITLREAPDIRLGSGGLKVRSYIGNVQDLNIDSYMAAFKTNLESADNLEKFIEEEETAISFKKYLKLKGQMTREFLTAPDKFVKLNTKKFYFIFPIELEVIFF